MTETDTEHLADTETEAPAKKTENKEDRLVNEGEIAGDYLEELLDVLDFDGDIDLDVEGDRAIVSIDGGEDLTKLVGRRGEVLDALGDKVARRVLDSGEREELAPMTPFERKIVHDAVAGVAGVRSESEGVEPSRRVVVLKDA